MVQDEKIVGKKINEKKSLQLIQKCSVAPALKNFKYILVLLILLLPFVFADGWTASQPSHATLYADTLTSKTTSSDVNVADNLYVTGNIRGLSPIIIPVGSASSPSIQFSGTTNTGINQGTLAGRVGIVTSGVQNAEFLNNGGTNMLILNDIASSSQPTLAFRELGNGIGRPGSLANALDFFTNSNVRMRIDNNGNVIIGSISSTNPSALVVISPNVPTNYGAGGKTHLAAYSNDAAAIDKGATLVLGGESGTVYSPYAFATIAGRKESATVGNVAGYLALSTTETSSTISEKMRITSSGNVGIGTTSPGAKLDVRGDLWLGANGGDLKLSGLTFTIQRGNANTMTFGEVLGGPGSYTFTLNQNYATANSDILAVQGNLGQTKLVVTNSGNVGIGTTSPGHPLDVAGSIRIQGPPAGNNADLYMLPTGAAVYNNIIFHSSTGVAQATITGYAPGGAANSGIIFYTSDSHVFRTTLGAVDTLTLAGSGNVGIGTASPTAKMHSEGANTVLYAKRTSGSGIAALFEYQTSSGGLLGLRATDTGVQYHFSVTPNFIISESAVADRITLQQGTGNVGIGTTSPGFRLDVAGDAHATSFPTSSDMRLKKNIVELTNVSDKLQNIHGVKFEWNERYKQLGRATNGAQIGLIAQDVEKEFPELVTTWGNESYRAVDYGRFSAVLLEAIKEQQYEIDELKAQNQNLNEKINKIISMIK